MELGEPPLGPEAMGAMESIRETWGVFFPNVFTAEEGKKSQSTYASDTLIQADNPLGVKATIRRENERLRNALLASALSTSVPPRTRDYVSDFLADTKADKKFRPMCPKCWNHDWKHFQFKNNKTVSQISDVGNITVRCDQPQRAGWVRGNCGWTGILYDVISRAEHLVLDADVGLWIQCKAAIHRKSMFDGAPDEYPHFKSAVTPLLPTCEADKPEGTRDVDKFLKEQQAKLWGSD